MSNCLLHEFAVEPACMQDWDVFKSLVAEFGVFNGRLLSQFPKTWPRLVIDATESEFTFIQKQKRAAWLKRLRECAMVRSGRSYDGNVSWLTNALNQQTDSPFRAILATETDGSRSDVLKASDLDIDTELWCCDQEDLFDRTVNTLTNVVCPLLQYAKHIIFVDQHFDPDTPRFCDTFRSFVSSAIVDRTSLPSIEYHFSIDDDNLRIRGSRVSFEPFCKHHFENGLCAGLDLTLVRLNPSMVDGGLHPRYILTEMGGMRIDWGLDTGHPGQKTDISLLRESFWRRRWTEFKGLATRLPMDVVVKVQCQ